MNKLLLGDRRGLSSRPLEEDRSRWPAGIASRNSRALVCCTCTVQRASTVRITRVSHSSNMEHVIRHHVRHTCDPHNARWRLIEEDQERDGESKSRGERIEKAREQEGEGEREQGSKRASLSRGETKRGWAGGEENGGGTARCDVPKGDGARMKAGRRWREGFGSGQQNARNTAGTQNEISRASIRLLFLP